MAPKRIDPRSTIKKIVKAYSSRSLSKNADVLMFLDYNLFVQERVLRDSNTNGNYLPQGLSSWSIFKIPWVHDEDERP
ncbi:MAG: hypothetical protein ALECFALPRED_006856 [Alectoria fallacina]|uniref:Uncharacterized protein n=1 Tax=Alectoria fallacina TaxID=1903189 RepID=A0A8H3IQC4_9LECA|nr:MAG: hypothetical protein ALECFALPRED_006856 [Alectoria fallacina]